MKLEYEVVPDVVSPIQEDGLLIVPNEATWGHVGEVARNQRAIRSGEDYFRIPFEDDEMCSRWSTGIWVVEPDYPMARGSEIASDLIGRAIGQDVQVRGFFYDEVEPGRVLAHMNVRVLPIEP